VSPEPLPLPPEDPAKLASFPYVPKERLPDVLFRIHRIDRGPEWFSTSQEWRWDPPENASELFGTCYTSTTGIGAFVETFSELPMLTQAEVDRRSLSVIALPPEPRWADMTDPAIVGTWGLDARISTGDNYETCQLWAQQLFAAGFNGVHYQARHDVTRGFSVSVALFGDPGLQTTALKVLRTHAVPLGVLNEARDVFHYELVPEVPLPDPFDLFDGETDDGEVR
jgi:hypothetical protein